MQTWVFRKCLNKELSILKRRLLFDIDSSAWGPQQNQLSNQLSNLIQMIISVLTKTAVIKGVDTVVAWMVTGMLSYAIAQMQSPLRFAAQRLIDFNFGRTQKTECILLQKLYKDKKKVSMQSGWDSGLNVIALTHKECKVFLLATISFWNNLVVSKR